jgi:hypothetical protein
VTPRDSAILDDILTQWHQWCLGYRKAVARGYNGVAQGMEQYRTSRQYDDTNGALDEAIDHRRMTQVDWEIGEMPGLEQTAIRMQARALYLGVSVFASPRLPECRTERQALVLLARDNLHARLSSAGVI